MHKQSNWTSRWGLITDATRNARLSSTAVISERNTLPSCPLSRIAESQSAAIDALDCRDHPSPALAIALASRANLFGSVQNLSHFYFGLVAWSGQAVILCCLSRSMFMYRLVDHLVPAMCLNLAAARLRAD